MRRRRFIQNLSAVLIGSQLPLVACRKNQSVTFGLCTDVHKDLIPDADGRMLEFIRAVNKHDVDFIIQLGDFCFPKQANRRFLDIYNQFNKPHYHVLGNHDMDVCDKREVMDFWGMQEAFYAFDQGPFHFVVLDPNFFLDKDNPVDYKHGNYYAHSETRAYIPASQLEWLRSDLANTDKPTIIFSHQGLELKDGVHNQAEVRALLEESGKVIACFAGHHHTDLHTEINGIHYLQMNSMSYQWLGDQYQCSRRFNDEINLRYPNLKKTAPYEKPLFAIVRLETCGQLIIEGVEGDFMPPRPEELNVPDDLFDTPLTASISSRQLSF